jgi:hypothetical protein
MNDHLTALLTQLTAAQKMKGSNALNEIVEALDKHLDKACSDHDTILDQNSDLERENMELRRRLRQAGVSDKVGAVA